MKTIKLTRGKYTLVDDRDYSYLNERKWHVVEKEEGRFYVSRTEWDPLTKKKKHIYMHREILGVEDGKMQVDHINNDPLDNRRSNIRICNQYENNWNFSLAKNNKSGYKGVSWHKSTRKWRSTIVVFKKQIHLGLFKSKKDAAIAYNEAAKKYFGNFSKLNSI